MPLRSFSMLLLESVCARYGDNERDGDALVLRDFSLRVEAGQVAAVIGPNGCGKSTMLRLASGLMRPTSGTIQIAGDDITSLSGRERAKRIALLPQNASDEGDMSAREMAALGRTPYLPPYGAPGARDQIVVERAMRAADVWEMRDRALSRMSGGERQRVALARALAQQPRVLLLDEPTSNLDIRYQHELLDQVRRLAKSQSLAVVLVLHQINLAAAVADILVLLNEDGTTRASGEPQNIMTRDNLQAVYATPLRIENHPKSGRPQAYSDWQFDE